MPQQLCLAACTANKGLIASFGTQLKEVDDTVYEADCQMITMREGQVDIGANA